MKNHTGLNHGIFFPCSSSPNCVSSMDQGKQAIQSLTYTGSRSEARTRLVHLLEGYKNCKILTENEWYIHAEFTTEIMRFKDDVEFLFPEEKIIHIKSASRIGYYDLGKNRSRLEIIRRGWGAL